MKRRANRRFHLGARAEVKRAQQVLIRGRRLAEIFQQDDSQGRGLAEVYAALGIIQLEDLREPTAAYQYLLSALELGPRPEVEAAVREALKRIETLQKRRVGELRRPSW